MNENKKELKRCEFEECNSIAISEMRLLNNNRMCLCKTHTKRMNKEVGGVGYLVPVNHEKFKISRKWIRLNEFNLPKENKRVIVSDGNIVDTAIYREGKWYIENYHLFIGKVNYWKVIV